MTTPPCRPLSVAIALSACLALVGGAGGWGLLSQLSPPPPPARQPMLIAPMLGVIDTCILGTEALADPATTLEERCSGPQGSAAALVESTLATLQPAASPAGPYPLGYTLQVPLLQLFQATASGWRIDQERIDRLVRTIRDTQRPLILYLFSTHFSSHAPIEKALAADVDNLAHTRDGPMAIDSYYGAALYPWTLASTSNTLTARRVEATQALLAALCQLPAQDIAKIQGLTLLGELHHLFPHFETGMGMDGPYRVSDYSRASIVGFQEFLRTEFGQIERLNRIVGSHYGAFAEVAPPSRDIRQEPLQHYTEHIDAFAQGQLPIAGWAFVERAAHAGPAWVHIYRNGVFAGKTQVNRGRQDVLQAKPAFGTANTGWRLDLDYRRWPTGIHRLDVFLEHAPGKLSPLGSRQVSVMGRAQQAPQPLAQQLPPRSTPAPSTLQAHIDTPQDQASLYYNPLVPLWHRFRQQQVVAYLQFFGNIVKHSCLANTPRYTHQIIPFTNPSWDADKFAIQASLHKMPDLQLGVSLYGDASYGERFTQWYRRSGHTSYGITEFHPLKALDATALEQVLAQHAAQGAQFVSFFQEPFWEGKRVPRPANMFAFDPENTQFGSDQLYRAAQALWRKGPQAAAER